MPASGEEILTRHSLASLRPPEPVAVTGEWMAELVAQYAQQLQAQSRWRPSVPAIGGVVLLIGVAIAAVVLHRDGEAYPSDPEKQNALDACSRTDPLFIRFLAADRAACYER